MALTDDQINALLKKELTRATGSSQTTTGPRPMQLGPLTWHDDTMRCAARGCGTPCLIKVRGIPYCSSHALTALNRIICELEGLQLDDCTCKAGKYSNGNIHTVDCNLYKLTKMEEVA